MDSAIASPTTQTGQHAQSVPADAAFEVRCGDSATLRDLRSGWNELLQHSDANSVFLTYEWMEAWLSGVCPRARLTIISVRSPSGELLGLAPFYRTSFRLLRLLPIRGLRVLGDVGAGAEYPDLIVRHGYEPAVAAALMSALLESAPSACVWMQRIAGWTGARERVLAAAQAANLQWYERPHVFAAAPLPNSFDEYLANLSGNQRSTLKRRTKQLQKAARVEFETCTAPAQLSGMLEDLFRLHELRWRADGQPGAFARRPAMMAFYRTFAPVALAQGWLRIYALRLDGVVQAIQYGYLYDGVYSQLQEGFDPAGPEGTGNVLRLMAIERLIAEGARTYDFLGEFTEHKRRWGAEQRVGCDLLLGRRTLKNRALFTRPIWPTGRYLHEHHPARGA